MYSNKIHSHRTCYVGVTFYASQVATLCWRSNNGGKLYISFSIVNLLKHVRDTSVLPLHEAEILKPQGARENPILLPTHTSRIFVCALRLQPTPRRTGFLCDIQTPTRQSLAIINNLNAPMLLIDAADTFAPGFNCQSPRSLNRLIKKLMTSRCRHMN